MLSQITFTPATGSAVTLHASTGNYQVGRAEGVFGPPSTRDVSRLNAGWDGSLDDTHLFDERKITFEGSVIGSSISNAVSNFETLTSAFATSLITPGTLTITLADGSTQRWCKVILSDAVQPSVSGGSALVDYQVSFRAPDPRWYGSTLKTSALSIAATAGTTSSSANVTNSGTAPSSPTFTWTPVATGMYFDKATVTVPSAYTTVSPQGSTIILSGETGSNAIAANDYVNCATRYINTNAVLNATTEWPVLYPGTSSWTWATQYAGSTSTSTCTMSWYDAWW